MKRFIVFAFIIIICLVGLFADPVYGGSSTSGSASMTINLNSATILNSNPRLYFGFTTDGTVGGEITPLTSNLVLAKNYSNATSFIATGTAYIFFRIASAQKLSFSLSWTNLTSTGGTNKSLYIYDKNGNALSSGGSIYSFNPEEDAVVDNRVELKFSTGSSISTTEDLQSTVTLTVEVES